MARRSVRAPSDQLNLDESFFEIAKLSAEWTPRTALARITQAATMPLEIEIGSGKGMFLSSFAAKFPDRLFVGNELAFKYARHAAGKLARDGLHNALMVQGDGLKLLRDHVPSATVTAVHVYFPDPWWKQRHRKRRVLNAALLAQVNRVLIAGGLLHFWTDVAEYYETTLALIAETQPQWLGPTPTAEPTATHEFDYRTHFERRCRLNREPVYRCRFEKPT